MHRDSAGRHSIWYQTQRHNALPTHSGLKAKRTLMGSVIKKRRKRMAKKKHRKLLKKTRVQRRKLGK